MKSLLSSHESSCLRLCRTGARLSLGFAGTLLAVQLGAAPAEIGAESPRPVAAPPRIAFERLVHDFGQVKRGDVVKYSFVFTNTSAETLQVLDVRPGCGCTTAGSWDKEIAAGKTGNIPLQFNSSGFAGTVAKTASVIFNDSVQSNVVLQLTGKVWVPIEVAPSSVFFQFDEDTTTSETKTVRIVSNLNEPLKLVQPDFTNRAFKVELKTVTPGKEFALEVSTVPPLGPGTVSALIQLKSSAAEMPVINVQTLAIERQPLTISPARLQLPAAASSNATQQFVLVRYSGTGALVCSNAAASFPGAAVQVRELQPGRLFQLAVTFPAGTSGEPGQQANLSVRSSHPKYPLITVPILPATPLVAPGGGFPRPAAAGPVPQESGVARRSGT